MSRDFMVVFPHPTASRVLNEKKYSFVIGFWSFVLNYTYMMRFVSNCLSNLIIYGYNIMQFLQR